MSIILFFGLALIIFIVGTVFTGLTVRHHWRQSQISKDFAQHEKPNK